MEKWREQRDANQESGGITSLSRIARRGENREPLPGWRGNLSRGRERDATVGKLFNLKEWLTVADAARHLAIAFGEDVTEADVLRLGLDGHLRLSVNFVNHTQARCGTVVRYTVAELIAAMASGRLPVDLEWAKFPKDLHAAIRGEPVGEELVDVVVSLRISDDEYLPLDEKVATLEGVWDLPMVGGERLDIEHKYQQLTDGPSVELETMDGAFVRTKDGVMCQLQESFDDNRYTAGSSAALAELKLHIAEQSIEPDKAELLLQRHKEARKEFLEKRKKRPAKEHYYPAGGLPNDAVIVVRTEALREFEQTVNSASNASDKPLTTNERNSLLTIIAALCDYSAIDHKDRGAASQIAKLTDGIGASVSDDTVRRVLAKIPDALESRMK